MANGEEGARNGIAVKIFAGVMTGLILTAVVTGIASNRSLAVLHNGKEVQAQQIVELRLYVAQLEERLRLVELEQARRGQR